MLNRQAAWAGHFPHPFSGPCKQAREEPCSCTLHIACVQTIGQKIMCAPDRGGPAKTLLEVQSELFDSDLADLFPS